MTDFLARIAARAVGQAAVARPRLPALFEQTGAPTDATLAIVEEEVVAPVRLPLPALDEAAPPAAARAGSPPSREPAARRADDVTGADAAARSSRRAQESAMSPSPTGVDSSGRAPERAEATRPQTGTPAPSSRPSPAPTAAAAPVTSALPAVLGARKPPLGAPAPVAREESSSAVRVHIGRLEVRANLQEAPKEQPRRKSTQPEGVSLADYLRGKREAG